MCDLTNPIFTDDNKAREHLEAIRWPNGVVCVHCGGTEQIKPLTGKGVRAGLYYCNDCEGQFTATVGTVFERSKVPLSKWILAFHLVCASKKGMSSHQLHRMLGVTYKTAWFMTHRIREAMTSEGGMLGGGGGTVEADETYWGNSPRSKAAMERKRKGTIHDKEKIVALVERKGEVRAFHVASINGETLKSVLHGNISKSANLMTDDYHGLVGTFHHVAPKHLDRYVTEFSFRYNTRTAMGYSDSERATLALKGVSGKRLTYRQPQRTRAAQALS